MKKQISVDTWLKYGILGIIILGIFIWSFLTIGVNAWNITICMWISDLILVIVLIDDIIQHIYPVNRKVYVDKPFKRQKAEIISYINLSSLLILAILFTFIGEVFLGF